MTAIRTTAATTAPIAGWALAVGLAVGASASTGGDLRLIGDFQLPARRFTETAVTRASLPDRAEVRVSGGPRDSSRDMPLPSLADAYDGLETLLRAQKASPNEPALQRAIDTRMADLKRSSEEYARLYERLFDGSLALPLSQTTSVLDEARKMISAHEDPPA
jgi:hypothetical protein